MDGPVNIYMGTHQLARLCPVFVAITQTKSEFVCVNWGDDTGRLLEMFELKWLDTFKLICDGLVFQNLAPFEETAQWVGAVEVLIS